MARKAKTGAASPYKLRDWRTSRGATYDDVGAALGMTGQNYGKIERGTVELRAAHIGPLAEFYDIDPSDLTRSPAETGPVNESTDSVAIVGFVGAGSIATLFSEGQGPFDEVEAPSNATENTVGLGIRGTSLGPAFDEGVVFYDDVHSPVTEEQHGRLCVVGLLDGRVLVKILRSAGDGTYHLFSNTVEEPMLNEEVAWAARVKDVRPR